MWVCISCSYTYIGRPSMHMPTCLHTGQAMFQCWLLNSEFNFVKYCVQVPNLLSLGGACLVCSCTFVLGFAEHMSPSKPEAPAQPYWSWSVTKQSRSLNSTWATGLWHKYSRQHNAYEQLQPARDAFETWPPEAHGIFNKFFLCMYFLVHILALGTFLYVTYA